jgi:isopentenyldiphosphate isomerase
MPEKVYNKVIVVDDHNQIIGAEFMFDAIAKGLIRRVVWIFVFNTSGQLLIQQRSENVFLPLLFDQSAGGHVDEGETSQFAAERELSEELGISDVEIKEIHHSFRTPQFFGACYQVVLPDTTTFLYDQGEVKTVFWLNPEDVHKQMRESPQKFSPTFVTVWQALHKKLIPKP